MNNNELPKGWDVVYDSDRRCFMFQSRRSGHRQVTRPAPDHHYQEYNPDHNLYRVNHRRQPATSPSGSQFAKNIIHTFPGIPLDQNPKKGFPPHQHGNERHFHSDEGKQKFQAAGPPNVQRQRTTVWQDLWEETQRGQQHNMGGRNHLPTGVHPDDSLSNFDVASMQGSVAESFTSMSTVAQGDARFEPAWHELRGLQRAREKARNAPMGNETAYRLVFEMPVDLQLIWNRHGFIIKLNKPCENYVQSMRMEAVPILKLNFNPDPYQPDLMFNVSNGTHIVYELRHYIGRNAPNKQLMCYIREAGNRGRHIVILERKWDVLTKHPVTVNLTDETYMHDGRHTAVADPRYMEIRRVKMDRGRGVGYEAVEFVPPRTAATVVNTKVPGIRQVSVHPRVNIPLLMLIIVGSDMMWHQIGN